jgi:hypothetical protein
MDNQTIMPISIIYMLSTKRPSTYPYSYSMIFSIVTVSMLSTAIVYSMAHRLSISIVYKISYKRSLYFGIPGV